MLKTLFTLFSHIPLRCVIFFTSPKIDFLYDVLKKVHYVIVGGSKMAGKKKSEVNLKGSLYAVFGVGIIIIFIWIYCFNLFMDRF